MPDNISVDVDALINQIKDTILDGFILGQIEKIDTTGIGTGLFKLLNKYGVHGDNAVNFIRELASVCGVTGGNENE